MQIYSWNMLFANKRLNAALEFIAKSDFDVFCLQEVPEPFLERLKELPCHIAYDIDVERSYPQYEKIYMVTLSAYPIVATGRVPFPDYWPSVPLRGRAFIYLMRVLNFTRMHNRGGLCADIEVDGHSVRVFNLHLILHNTHLRIQEFELAMAEREKNHPAIVCGDFNTLEKPHITILSWLLGGSVREALFYRRERTHIEKRFVEHELINPLRGRTTHPLSQSQLDHILVSHSFTIKNAEVIRDRYGSDHHPIHVEIV